MKILELTDSNYNKIVINGDKHIFIDFYSPLCGPCQTLQSYLPDIAKYAENKDTLVVKCDITKNPKINGFYKIITTPLTIIVNKDTKKINGVKDGVRNIYEYFEVIDKNRKINQTLFSKFLSLFK